MRADRTDGCVWSVEASGKDQAADSGADQAEPSAVAASPRLKSAVSRQAQTMNTAAGGPAARRCRYRQYPSNLPDQLWHGSQCR